MTGHECADPAADPIPQEYMLETEGDVAAVIAEPIRWTPYIPKPEYWQRIRAACDRQVLTNVNTRRNLLPDESHTVCKSLTQVVGH